MKILLTTLNTKYIHSNLALKYLYESAGIYRDLLEIKEFTINNDDMSVYMEIMRGGYDAVCFSCYIWNISRIEGLIKDIKRSDPEIKIIVGGPEVSYDSEELLNRVPEIDLVIRGEGDKVFCGVVEMLAEGVRDFGERIITGSPAEPDAISFPYTSSDPDPDKIVYYESARGCPYSCSFCLSSVSRGVRLFPMERVKKELEYFLERKVRQVKFVDRTFNVDTERAAEIMKFLIENDNGVTNFHFELCGDRISDEMLEAFETAREGLFQVEIGVQSAHDRVLEACRRKVDFEKLKKNTLKILSGRNVHVHLDLIAGLPYETFADFGDSFNQVYELGPDDLQLGFLKLLKGTEIRNRADEHGYIFREREPYEVISNKYISAEEIIRLKMIENVLELYYNKPGFRSTLKYMIESSGKTPFEFYEDLAVFYYEEGYHAASQSKNGLYDILRKYIEKSGCGLNEGLKELLLYDRISVASPSSFSDREYSDRVHEYLRSDSGGEGEGNSSKVLIKKVNYMAFEYNVDEFAAYGTELRKTGGKRLLVFYPGIKDAGGRALCRRI
ncbi:MAG: DUF4080 domain-containing protein [Bacillota bacterium]|nr:DUF4080 domain-containing protein [Bacillota bacterium]